MLLLLSNWLILEDHVTCHESYIGIIYIGNILNTIITILLEDIRKFIWNTLICWSKEEKWLSKIYYNLYLIQDNTGSTFKSPINLSDCVCSFQYMVNCAVKWHFLSWHWFCVATKQIFFFVFSLYRKIWVLLCCIWMSQVNKKSENPTLLFSKNNTIICPWWCGL